MSGAYSTDRNPWQVFINGSRSGTPAALVYHDHNGRLHAGVNRREAQGTIEGCRDDCVPKSFHRKCWPVNVAYSYMKQRRQIDVKSFRILASPTVFEPVLPP